MHALSFLSGAFLLASGAMGLACNDDTIYCGHTLVDMGWTRDQIWQQLKPNGLPDSLSRDKIDHTLFICEDRWYWTNADLHYKDYCLRGCQNRGSGKDDACWVSLRTAANGTASVGNETVQAVNQTVKTAAAVVKRASVLLA